jgi:hypothetical protein
MNEDYFGIWNVDYNWLVSHPLSHNHPSILAARGRFEELMMLGVSVVVLTPGPGEIDHAVVAHGYDTVTRKILVAMGWGNHVPDRWIDPSTLRYTLGVSHVT